MFAIFRQGRKTVRKTFEKYDQARCYLRRMIRENRDKNGYHPFFDRYSNPNLGEFGYSIRRVTT